MKKYKHKSNTSRTGFYVALSICLVAVGLAVWSAYTSVSDYISSADDKDVSATLVEETVQDVMKEVSTVNDATPLEIVETPTEEKKSKSITIYENSSSPTENADMQSELNSLQAVLKVEESLICPIKNQSVLKQYSENAVYSKTMQDYRAHTGCDFAAEIGENVYSMSDGVVSSISFSEMYGVIVMVDSKDFTVIYCGLDSNTNVKMKDEISQGDVIGTVSQIPCECEDEPHIHVEIKVGDRLIDPLTVIDNSN